MAQISEEIVTRPFQDETALLSAGVHLHWALPDALTRGRHRIETDGTDHRTRFPVVPNRWLVRRAAVASLAARAWIVQSDYLHPDGAGDSIGVAVPFPPDPARGRHRPFRFLGRALPVELSGGPDPTAEHVPILTAVGFELAGGGGYSDPTFAALYPNCHSVFGFHDGEIGTVLPDGLRYDLVGWYADEEQDFLRTAAAGTADLAAQRATLERYAAWTFDVDDATAPLRRSAYYASVGFRPAGPTAPGEPTTVTIGNTGTEALSTALAARLDAARRFVVEQTLEAVQLDSRVEHRSVDLDARFRELRHEKGFTPHRGDRLWTVRPATTAATTPPADVEQAKAHTEVDLPPALAGLLATLNEAQQDGDRVATELESARRQLFADWYKYQLCAYRPADAGDRFPDIDEAMAFLATKGLQRIRELAAMIAPGPDTVTSRRQDAYATAARALAALNDTDEVRAAKVSYELAPQVAPRFWQPTDPVVLLTGTDARATERHGQDGRLRADRLLTCRLVPADAVDPVLAGDIGALTELIARLRAHETDDGTVAFRDSDGAPWHPFQLEWEVELFPLRERSNVGSRTADYHPGFVTGHYGLTEHGPDLVPSGGWTSTTNAATVYSGSSLLTRHAGERLVRALAEHLRRGVLPAYRAAMANATDPAEPVDLAEPADVIDALRDWYERTHPDARTASPGADTDYTVIRAYQELLGMDYLAQSLGGFNDALLMHRQVKQLPIGDPLGFAEYRAFADTIRDAVGTSNRSAPEPLNDFNPIRSGALRLLRLRLVDTFGQTRDVPVERMIPAETLTVPGNPDLVGLPPRLSQPARIVFRWLAADLDQETNDHAGSTPVCGWFLPYHLDTALMVYDNTGRALGSIDGLARWRPAPGGTGADTVVEIDNPHLRATVEDIVRHGPEFVDQFLAALDAALDNIEPETSDQHIDLAVLVGRPIALVRAALDIELLGLPAVHQGWNQFRQDMARGTRQTDGFTRVEFPIRLGAHRQLDDGLIGYWIGSDTTFHTPQSERFPHPAIRTYGDGPLYVPHAVDDAPSVVRMLVDPRGSVHVTSGIQPVKTIGIPPPLYAPALGAIEVTFPCAGLLTEVGAVNLPLPAEPGYRWAWADQARGGWTEVTQAPTIGRDRFVRAIAERCWDQLTDPRVAWLKRIPGATGAIRAVGAAERVAATLDPEFRALTAPIETVLAPLGDHLLDRAETIATLAGVLGTPIWQALLDPRTGWLRPLPGDPDRALVTARDSRPLPVLAQPLGGTEPLVGSILDLGAERIGPAGTAAAFGSAQEVRDGWLTLRRDI